MMLVPDDLKNEALNTLRRRAAFGVPKGRSALVEANKIGAMCAFALEIGLLSQADCEAVMQILAAAAGQPVAIKFTEPR